MANDEKAPRWETVKEIFAAALEVKVADRPCFVKTACAGEAKLIAEVESWLASYDESDGFIETPVFSADQLIDGAQPMVGRRFGNYEILYEIGSGGMGAVYKAKRTDGEFEQDVALKIVRQSIVEKKLIDRFRRERQILASLNHPNIAKLLDGGVSDQGEPFIVMEYVEGELITDYLLRVKPTVTDTLQLFLKVCSAVSYAHRNLIIHRDIKPGNIMVTAGGEPKLLDFGLAKLSDPDLSADAAQTQTALRALTPAYASPEQLRNEPMSTASDTYSLGIVLFELLTGERPFQFEGKTLDQIIRTISERDPAAPSETRAVSGLKGDLDNIILMALRKEPDRRYRSVEAFIEDIERYLKGLPVLARPSTFRYRSGKFIRRHGIVVAAVTIILVAVVGGLAATLWQARIAARERDQALQAQARSEQLNGFLQSILSAASPDQKGKDAKVIEVLNDALEKIDTQFPDQPDLRAQALLTLGQTYNKLGLMDEAEKTLRRALQLNSELYGENNKATVSSMIYLGATILNQAKYDEAEQLFTRAIESGRSLSSDGSKDLALALDGLGELYVRKRDFEKAKPLLQQSVSMYDKLLGENSSESAFSLISLARAQAFAGEVDAAENTYRRSVAILRQLTPRNDVALATALLNFGSLLAGKGSYDEGIQTMLEAENIFLQKQGESYTTFEANTYLCVAYYSAKDYAKALTAGQKSVDMGRKLKLEAAPDFVETLRIVGLSLTRTGKPKDGESILRDALDRSRTSQPQSVPYAEGALGECLTDLDKFDEAELLLRSSFDALSKTLSPDSTLLKPASKRLFDLYTKWKKPDLAQKYAV